MCLTLKLIDVRMCLILKLIDVRMCSIFRLTKHILPSTRPLTRIWMHKRNTTKLHVQVYLNMNTWMFETFDVHVTVQHDKFHKIKLTVCRNYSNLFLEWKSTCFGKFLYPSSGVFHCPNSHGICHTGLLCAQWKTPDDGQRNSPKHVEFHSKNKLEKYVHLVGFIIRRSKHVEHNSVKSVHFVGAYDIGIPKCTVQKT
jgi:hypothetical protein